ncbi:hypothetical protein F9C07_12167 [Aspergillus flavus]|uniref:Uncharacterized protein n=4 Tax=Aspergillus subgen. Circumdati TaxID=2720871 RepID=A0A7U2R119_ASPFN|nr:unnamed protein product [Aspergillus oryzae RIB40]KAF7626157.1 hypothetical protein AFLA_013553 [Aspergillus flavus NRRL3357]KAJ1706485.1 hypothetical protein NYO67_11367 [Aspergillus flavus]GMG36523.1 unnamed protein product [Aspergillus oryzae]QRD92188.1 hypothetical protein F9C07_12167 [Aspergillus flavus]RAQ54822.1 hypothetical protein AFGD_012449 [Aspergillus flavus]
MSELPKCERDFDIAYQEWERDSAEWFDQEAWDKALESWISPFLEERDFGYAILQRRRRLLSIKPAARPKCEDKSQMKSPDYQEAERKREEEVNELMEAYWTSNRTLLAMDETMPLAFNVVEIVLLRSHRDRHGRPYSWVMDRLTCALTGGCCGRACGCCEKPLLTYYHPLNYKYPDGKMEVGVYGHCTAECPCCIQVRHRYHPHPRLPKSAF